MAVRTEERAEVKQGMMWAIEKSTAEPGLKRVTALSTRKLFIESNHDGMPALLDGEFHMLARANTVTFHPDLGLVWAPVRRRGPW